jgi:2-alkyl-3-oxoalkanoate reductase
MGILTGLLGWGEEAEMRVLVAGASGAVGQPLVTQLVAAGHTVVGMTRSDSGAQALRALGAEPVVADALDAAAVERAVRGARPEAVIEELTALPRTYTPEAMRDTLAATNQVRAVGGGNVQAAAERAGARRYIAQSGCYYYVPGPGLATEETGFAVDGPPLVAGGGQALLGIEKRVLGAQSLEGIVLRYGFFYGPGTWYAADGNVAEQVRRGQFPIAGGGGGVWPFVHIADAAAVTVAALTRGARGAYNVTDDEPSPLAVWLPAYARWLGAPAPAQVSADEVADPDARFYAMQLRGASNAKAKDELGLQPRRREWLGDTK